MLKKIGLVIVFYCIAISLISCSQKTSIEATINDDLNISNNAETVIMDTKDNNIQTNNQNVSTKNYSISQISHVRLVSDYDEKALVNEMDTVEFGTYPQDDSSGNSKQPIEWLVLYRENNEALLLSKFILDCKSYNEVREKVTWESCTLREWLNSTFYNEAFNDSEKSIIITSLVNYDDNNSNTTNDKVFLLSSSEAENYILFDRNRTTSGTNYAKSVDNNGKNLDVSYIKNRDPRWFDGNSSWYLVDGNSSLKVSYVYEDGYVGKDGALVYEKDKGIRPAIRIRY